MQSLEVAFARNFYRTEVLGVIVENLTVKPGHTDSIELNAERSEGDSRCIGAKGKHGLPGEAPTHLNAVEPADKAFAFPDLNAVRVT